MTEVKSRFVLTREWLDSGIEKPLSAKSLWLENKNCHCHGVKAISLDGSIDATFPHENFITQIVQEIIKGVVDKVSKTNVVSPEQILQEFSVEEITRIIQPTVMKWMDIAITEGGTTSLESLGLTGVDATFGSQIPEIASFVDQYAARLTTNVGTLMEFDLKEIVQEGIANGDSLHELTYRTQLWAGELVADPESSAIARQVGVVRTIPHRAELIARTEMNRAYNAGRRMSWSTVPDVVVGKYWGVSTKPCEFCAAAGAASDPTITGRVVPLDEPFFPLGHLLVGTSGGTMILNYEEIQRPPLHPNCRCSLMPVTRSELKNMGLSEADIKRDTNEN